MVYKFWASTPYGNVALEESKAFDLIATFIEKPVDRIMILAMDGDKPVGFIAAVASETLLTRDKLAHEMAWWMEPEYRKSRVALELVQAYEFWAKKVGCKLIQMSTVETDQVEKISKYYSRKGYRLIERSFLKEI